MDPLDMLDRLTRATDEHDLEALVGCFAPEYRNETPLHPARGFRGSEQVRRNWTQIFAAVPDLRAQVLRSAADGATVWSEWEMSGTRQDGTAHLMRGVVIFEVEDGRATAARFYLEPVDHDATDVNAALGAALGTAS